MPAKAKLYVVHVRDPLLGSWRALTNPVPRAMAKTVDESVKWETKVVEMTNE